MENEKDVGNKELKNLDRNQIENLKKIISYKLPIEANIVSILYKQPEEFFNIKLELEEFSHNTWRVYFVIAHDLIVNEQKKSLDDVTIGVYLDKHLKLKEKYDEYNGYKTIQEAKEYVDVGNLHGYIEELRKWNVLIKLCKNGFHLPMELSKFIDMSTEEIYDYYECMLNHTFSNVEYNVKSYDLTSGIHELIEELDAGIAIGLPYSHMPLLTNLTGGQNLGTITLLGGLSNVGKSTIARSTLVPSAIEHNEKLVIMVNEDSIQKWQREMLVWVCNNIFDKDIQKYYIRNGKYSKEFKETLHKAGKWLEEKTKDNLITIIPLLQYKTSTAIKLIRKYASLGVKYFLLDTFKMDAGNVSSNSWLEMQQGMVNIKDTVKSEALNVHILITFQLDKRSAETRFYTQNNIGLAKNIVDVASTCIMIRDLNASEYPGEKKELKVFEIKGEDGITKIEQKLDSKKRYQVFFIVKNQEGVSNSYQIVAEHDKSRNIIKEIGITSIMPDF